MEPLYHAGYMLIVRNLKLNTTFAMLNSIINDRHFQIVYFDKTEIPIK